MESIGQIREVAWLARRKAASEKTFTIQFAQTSRPAAPSNKACIALRSGKLVCRLGRMFVKREMWFVANAVLISILSLTCLRASASALDDSLAAVAALQVKADQAQPRDRCLLYARLVSRMTDLAAHQLNSGDSGQASETLKLVQQYAEKIHVGVAKDSKKLKDAELLMQHTSFRLQDILSGAPYEDRQTLEATLKQLNQVQTQLMMQVFKK